MQRHRRRRLKIAAAVSLGALPLIFGGLYFSGTLESWQDDRGLSSACDGVLEKDSLRAALGSSRAYARDSGESQDGALASCNTAVRSGQNSMDVQVRWSSHNDKVTQSLGRTSSSTHESSFVPLGTWPGVLTSSQGLAHASVTLACRNRGSDGLTVDSQLTRPSDGSAMDSSSRLRTSFARATVEIAKKAATTFGCDHDSSDTTQSVSTASDKPPVPLPRASGTCEPLRPLASAAKKVAVTHARESESSKNAPIEDCVLTGQDGKIPLYRISAYYGSYAKSFSKNTDMNTVDGEAGVTNQGALTWGTAQCPGTAERAIYTFSLLYDGGSGAQPENPPRSFKIDALTAFAKKSAREHGCVAPHMP